MAAVTRAAWACVPPRVRPRRVRLALAGGTAAAATAAILSGNDKNNEPKRHRRRRHTSPVDMYPTGWMMLYDEGVANKSTFRIDWERKPNHYQGRRAAFFGFFGNLGLPNGANNATAVRNFPGIDFRSFTILTLPKRITLLRPSLQGLGLGSPYKGK